MALQRETVARAALHVLDEVGLEGLTMRRLAAYLEVQNPSLYWHFTNKQELINCMAELMIAEAFALHHCNQPGRAFFVAQIDCPSLATTNGDSIMHLENQTKTGRFIRCKMAYG